MLHDLMHADSAVVSQLYWTTRGREAGSLLAWCCLLLRVDVVLVGELFQAMDILSCTMVQHRQIIEDGWLVTKAGHRTRRWIR